MRLTNIEFLPAQKVSENYALLQSLKNDIENYTNTELGDTYEKLGIDYYFNGDFDLAKINLEASISDEIGLFRPSKSTSLINILLGNINFRQGNIQSAENHYRVAYDAAARIDAHEYRINALSNLSLLRYAMKKTKDALKKARESLELSEKYFSKSSTQYENSLRTLILLYIKNGDHAKAENLLEESNLPMREKILIDAGLKFAVKDFRGANAILNSYSSSLPNDLAHTKEDPGHRKDGNNPASDQVAQKDSADLRDLLHDILIKYNSYVLQSSNGTALNDSYKSINKLIRVLNERKTTCNLNYLDKSKSPYNFLRRDAHPSFVAPEQLQFIFVVLTLILASVTESAFLNAKFSKGLEIESGYVIRDDMAIQRQLNEFQTKLVECVKLTESIVSGLGLEISKTGLPEEFPVHENSIVFNDSISIHVDNEFAPSALVSSKRTDLPEVAIMKDITKNFGLFRGMVNADPNDKAIDLATAKLLKDNYKIGISNKGQVFNISPKKIKDSAPPSDFTTETKTTDPETQIQGTPSSPTQSENTGTIPSEMSQGEPPNDEQSRISKDSSTIKPLGEAKYQYFPDKHDALSLKSEALPLVRKFGRDDVTAWIQWALANAGGISFGNLGFGSVNPKDSTGFNREHLFEGYPNNTFLEEARNRLLRIDTSLPMGNAISGSSSQVAWGTLENKVVISILLVKISSQIDMKKEAGLHLIQLENLVDSLLAHLNRSLESRVYFAICCKFRLEYEDWCTPMMSESRMLPHLVNKLLPLAKRYLEASENLNDATFRRDSLKKMVNLYLEIGTISSPSSKGNATENKAQGIDEASTANTQTSSAASVDSGSISHQNGSQSQPPSPSKGPPEAKILNEDSRYNISSIEELELLGESEVEELEASDPEWVRIVAKLRARQFFLKMKSLGNPKNF